MATSDDLQVQILSIVEIRCSFCDEHLREDLEDGEGPYGNQRYLFATKAKRLGWGAMVTRDRATLNLCPTHIKIIKESGLLQ